MPSQLSPSLVVLRSPLSSFSPLSSHFLVSRKQNFCTRARVPPKYCGGRHPQFITRPFFHLSESLFSFCNFALPSAPSHSPFGPDTFQICPRQHIISSLSSNATSRNGRTRTCLVRLSVSILSKKTSRQNARGEKRASSKFPASIAVTHSLTRHVYCPVGIVIRSPILLLLRRSSASACAVLLCIESMGSISQNRRSTTIHSLFCWRRNGRWMNAVVRRPLRRHPRRGNSLPLLLPTSISSFHDTPVKANDGDEVVVDEVIEQLLPKVISAISGER